MRKSLVPIAYVMCLSLVAGVLILTVPSVTYGIGATVDIHPKTLNLKSNGTWITALIRLPEGYEVSDINVTTVRLETVPAAWGSVEGNKLMVKFDRQTVIDYIWAFKLYHMGIPLPKEGVEVELTITGSLNTETIEGSPPRFAIVNVPFYCTLNSVFKRCYGRPS